MSEWLNVKTGLGTLGFGGVALGLALWQPGEWAVDPGIGFYIGALHAAVLLLAGGLGITIYALIQSKKEAAAEVSASAG